MKELCLAFLSYNYVELSCHCWRQLPKMPPKHELSARARKLVLGLLLLPSCTQVKKICYLALKFLTCSNSNLFHFKDWLKKLLFNNVSCRKKKTFPRGVVRSFCSHLSWCMAVLLILIECCSIVLVSSSNRNFCHPQRTEVKKIYTVYIIIENGACMHESANNSILSATTCCGFAICISTFVYLLLLC